MIGKINVGGGDGGLEINGIIESYVASAGGSITAGDFVTFTNSLGAGAQTQAATYDTGDNISAVALDADKVMLVYRTYYNSYRLYGVVCTINGTTITRGEETALHPQLFSGGFAKPSVVKLSNNQVFVAYYVLNSNYYLYGVVCTINGTTITAGTNTQLVNAAQSTSAGLYMATLDYNRVFIAQGHAANYYLYGVVCTINGTTITAGTNTQLASYAPAAAPVVQLSNNKVLVVWANAATGTQGLYGVICTINGTTITAGTDTQLVNDKVSAVSAVTLNYNQVFIAWTDTNTGNYYLHGVICTINGTTITADTNTQLTSYRVNNCAVLSLSNSKIFVAVRDYATGYWRGAVCTINGTTITAGTDTQLVNSSAVRLDVSALNKHKVFVLWQSGIDNLLYGTVAFLLTQTVTSGSDEILGVAKTSAAAGASVDVYIPNV